MFSLGHSAPRVTVQSTNLGITAYRTPEQNYAVHDYFTEQNYAVHDYFTEQNYAVHDYFTEQNYAVHDYFTEQNYAVHDYFTEQNYAVHDYFTVVEGKTSTYGTSTTCLSLSCYMETVLLKRLFRKSDGSWSGLRNVTHLSL